MRVLGTRRNNLFKSGKLRYGVSVDKRYNIGYTRGMKTAISIPDALFEAAEQLAKRLEISRSELYQRAVKRFVAEHGNDLIRESLDEIYGNDPDGSRLDPAIEFLQNVSLPEDKW